MAVGKGGLALIVLAAVVVPFSLVMINYAGTPIYDATGTIVDLREGVQRRSAVCYATIRAEGVGLVSDKFSDECPKKLQVGQRVAFRYHRGRFVTDARVVARPEGQEDLKILDQTSVQ